MPFFHATHFKVTDEAITATGTREFYQADDREQAVEKCLYTHRLHDGRAYSFSGTGMPPHFIVMCHTCGQIAITPEPHTTTAIREWIEKYPTIEAQQAAIKASKNATR
jgi:hypothetical protein